MDKVGTRRGLFRINFLIEVSGLTIEYYNNVTEHSQFKTFIQQNLCRNSAIAFIQLS